MTLQILVVPAHSQLSRGGTNGAMLELRAAKKYSSFNLQRMHHAACYHAVIFAEWGEAVAAARLPGHGAGHERG